MKKVIAVTLALLFMTVSASFAAERVRGYLKKDGTYVAPHFRSSPDGNQYNNWSSKGNVNPYTGKKGTKDSYGYRSGYGNKNPFGGYRSGGHTYPDYNYGRKHSR
ncbi:hypothetical protein MNBD_NITROSPINAE02-172 [hydrothermal vent metagenome]|uniref:Uncharacterized protein n=1 Tax=hydrothermal vent metagenome TaxID=652676 RepID=A0A3B1C6P9_9ZZZZ